MSRKTLSSVTAKIKSAPRFIPQLIFLLLLAIWLGILTQQQRPTVVSCSGGRVTIVDRSTSTKLMCARAVKTETEKQRGLANRTKIPGNDGMLFVFETDDRHGIWMKDMRMDIDIIWIDANKRIVTVERNVKPNTYPKVFQPTKPARYVLEVAAGQASKLRSGQRLEFIPSNP